MPTKIPATRRRAYPRGMTDAGLQWLDTCHFALGDRLDEIAALMAVFIACDTH